MISFKNILKEKKILVILGGIILFIGIITINDFTKKIKITLTVPIVEANTKGEINYNLPLRIKIPKIKVDTTVESVGLTSNGAMDAPLGPTSTAWFNQGPIPGEEGSSVIDGHSGWKNGTSAVFDNLYKLKKGDKISIENGKGEIVIFKVREVKIYNPKADATSVFFSNDKKSHLNLIACTGAWDYVQKSHSKRLVVFADKEI